MGALGSGRGADGIKKQPALASATGAASSIHTSHVLTERSSMRYGRTRRLLRRGHTTIDGQSSAGHRMRLRRTAGRARRWRPPPAVPCGPSARSRRRACARAPRIPCPPSTSWSGRATNTRSIGVSMGPGQMAFTRIFSGASRTDRLAHEADHAELAHRIHRAVRRALQSRRGRREEQAAAAARAHLGDGGLGGAQHHAEVEVDGELERLQVDPLRPQPDPGCPTWFQTKSSPLKRVARLPHDAAGGASWQDLYDLGHDPVGSPPRRGDLADDGLHPLSGHVDHGDLRAFTGEAKGAGAAIPEPAAVTIPIFPCRRMAFLRDQTATVSYLMSQWRPTDHAISCPPLTSSTAPVMKAAASEARKRMAWAISSG